MKTSELFRLARKRIEKGYNTKICYAIRDIGGVGVCAPWVEKYRAEDIVKERIAPRQTVATWAWNNPSCKGADRAYAKDFREFRIRWLKALEAEFKAKGD